VLKVATPPLVLPEPICVLPFAKATVSPFGIVPEVRRIVAVKVTVCPIAEGDADVCSETVGGVVTGSVVTVAIGLGVE
jgi:hypothetical protein